MPTGVYRRTEYHKRKISLSLKGKRYPGRTPTNAYQVGHKSGMTDKKHSKETKIKMSNARKGFKPELSTREKFSKRMKLEWTGKNNPRWNNNATSLKEMIRKSDEYSKWKIGVFLRDRRFCVKCNNTQEIEVHHKNKSFAVLLQEFFQQYSQFSPLEDKETLLRLALTYEPFWDLDNGITLCKKCHTETDNYPNELKKFWRVKS